MLSHGSESNSISGSRYLYLGLEVELFPVPWPGIGPRTASTESGTANQIPFSEQEHSKTVILLGEWIWMVGQIQS